MTIRFQLALLFTALVSLILSGFAIFAYFRMSVEMGHDFDAMLTGRAITAAVITLEEDELNIAEYNAVKQEFERSKLPDEDLIVLNTSNTILFRSDSGERRFFSLVPTAMEAAQKQGSLHFTQETPEGKRRTLYRLHRDNNQEFMTIASAIDRRGEETLRGMIRTFAYGILGVVVLSFGAGWLFAKRMLAPVDVMTRLAEEISALDLHRRIAEAHKSDEISRLAHAFNGMFDRLEQAFTAQRQFIAHASHELRTPLTAAEGELEVALMNESLPESAKAALAETLDNTRHLRSMVNDLLLLARAESGIASLSQADVEIAEIVFEALDIVQPRFPGRSISVNFENTSEEQTRLFVRCNTELMRVAVQNILENALKYSPSDTPVVVSMGADMYHTSPSTPSKGSPMVLLHVQDFGIGIAEDDKERVFKPFVRSERTSDIPGTGIGLALVSVIMKQHGGVVRLRSAPNEGTTVILSLPMVVPHI